MKKQTKIPALCFALVLVFGLLSGCGRAAVYEVFVNDADGKGVPGVTIQFCSETECSMGTTDENGIAIFDKPAGSYTVHVLVAPEGYSRDDTEYAAPARPGRVTIALDNK